MFSRSEKIAEVIHKELNNFLIKESEPPKDTFITVTKVEVTKDMSAAFVFLSVLPVTKSGLALNYFKRISGPAAHYISRYLTLFKVPKLIIKIDDFAIKHRSVERELNKLAEEEKE